MKNTRKSYPKNDLTNERFGHLKALQYIKGGKWKCLCDCGNYTVVDTRNLKKGHTRSCGCLRYSTKNIYDMSKYEDENLKVISRKGSDNQRIAMWECLCKKCGNIFISRGSSIRNGSVTSCGCVHSKNEALITKILTDNNINFSTQYSFDDLKGNNRKLRFDFAIFDENDNLLHLIEFQGKQHYEKPLGQWGENFERTLEYDKIKKEYCNKNNIKLIEIKYDYEPVETISS